MAAFIFCCVCYTEVYDVLLSPSTVAFGIIGTQKHDVGFLLVFKINTFYVQIVD